MLDAGAHFSDCRTYRYMLWRYWSEEDSKHATFIGLNPSTADETENDPTVRRCINYAKREDCSGMTMLNIFAYRSTDPEGLRSQRDPVGTRNDRFLIETAMTSDIVIAAWGIHGAYQDRGEAVRKMLEAKNVQLLCLGTTKAGHPKHPLYLRKNAALVDYKGVT